MKHKKTLFFAVLIFIIITSISFSAYAKENNTENDTKDGVTTTEYLLFSDLVYGDLSKYSGDTVSSFIYNDKLFSKSSKSHFHNNTGRIFVPDVMKKYIGDWQVDKCFSNNKTGFYAAAFKNESKKEIVIAFRGTTDAVGKDGLNDAEFGLLTKNAPQMDDAFNKTDDYIAKNTGYTITTTGHSLGGGLAIELAHYYDLNSQTFNAAQITTAIYYDNWDKYGNIYRGFDLWKHIDHVNEDDFVVGTYEYGSMKKAIKHQNLNSTNTFFAHAIQHMIDINEKSESISISKEISRNFLNKKSEIYKNIEDYKALSLGNTKNNILESHKLFISNDVFFAGDGNDFVNAKGGDDVLIGGNGDDTLDGGTGDDTYVYYEGNGSDTILDPGGNDKLIIHTEKDVTYKKTADYYIVYLDSKQIAKISITARLDGFCNKPYEDNGTKPDSFEIKVVNEKDFVTSKEKIKLDGKWNQVKKATISGFATVDILDKNNKIVSTLENKVASVSLPNLCAFVAYDENTNSYVRYIYSKDNGYYFHIRSTANQKISFLLDTQLIDKTHAKYTAADIECDESTVFTLRRTTGAPRLWKGKKELKLVKADYLAASKISINKSIMILENGTKYTFSVKTQPDSTQSNNVYWESAEENIIKIDDNGCAHANNLGQTTISATVDGITDTCHVYVLSKTYISIFIVGSFVLSVFIIFSIINRIIRRKKKKKSKQVKKKREKETV